MAKRAKEPFEITEHTADVGIIARGESLAEAFANAALGMFSLMAELPGVAEEEERGVDLEARDWEGLLVRWLSELLYYLDAEELLFKRFHIEELSPVDPSTDPSLRSGLRLRTGSAQGKLYRLRARAWGERIDRERHQLHFGVKAVTRHALEIGRENSGWRLQVLFDI